VVELSEASSGELMRQEIQLYTALGLVYFIERPDSTISLGAHKHVLQLKCWTSVAEDG
jgi:hypothetical protein